MAQIDKPNLHFNTKLYNGTGSSNAITGVGFEPSFTWIKRRNSATAHHLHNAISGATKVLNSNTTNAESTDAQKLSSFDSDGFTVGTNGDANNSSGTFASWNWKANGAGSANTDGSISSTVSANTTAGFSICKWAGSGANATIGHGLGVAPKMVITKSLGSSAWGVYHESLGNTKVLFLDTTAGESANVAYWNNTSPTSTVFSVGTDSSVNHSGNDMIAYCFAEKKGYSKFGSYTGNGNVDGTFVYTGFKPAWVMIKGSGSTGNYYSWSIFDTTRQTFNVNAGKTLYANRNYEEGKRGQGTASTTIPAIDMLSNGFKCRVLNDEVNTSSGYIYMAFAEEPLVGSNNIPATAR